MNYHFGEPHFKKCKFIFLVIYIQLFYVSRSRFPTMEVQPIVTQCTAWIDKLLRERVNMKLKLLGAFGHVVVSKVVVCHNLIM